MAQHEKKEVELPKIRKVPHTWDGKVIEYLLKHSSGRAATDLATEAITSYWLVEALEGKVSDDEFRQACRAATENLSKKLASIQQMSGLNASYKVPSAATPILATTQNDEEDDNDDWDMNLQLTDELIAVNQALGEVN